MPEWQALIKNYMDLKPNFKPNNPDLHSNLSDKQILEDLDQKWQKEENTLKKLLDPIESDNSTEAWELRNSFLESIEDMKKETDGIEKKLYELGYYKNDIGMFVKDINVLEIPGKEYIDESALESNFYDKNVSKDRILKLLALNISEIATKESLIFREKLFELGCHISYLIESLDNIHKNSEEANNLYNKFSTEWLNQNPKAKLLLGVSPN